MRLNMQVL